MSEIFEPEQSTLNKKLDHWLSFYKMQHVLSPSFFAQWVTFNYDKIFPKDLFYKKLKLLDWCCGNGRDSYYLANIFDVCGIDFATTPRKTENTNFININVKAFMQQSVCDFDVVYSRFSLHTVEESIENMLLDWCNSFLFVEARSDQGFSELTHDHYRRLCNYNHFLNKLKEHNFQILYKTESRGLARFEDEDPIIIRVLAISSKNPLANFIASRIEL